MYPQLAGNDSISIPAVPQIFAGSAEIVTNRAQGGTNVTLDALSVIALVGDKIVQYNPAGSDGSEVAAGILCGKLQLAHKIQRRCQHKARRRRVDVLSGRHEPARRLRDKPSDLALATHGLARNRLDGRRRNAPLRRIRSSHKTLP